MEIWLESFKIAWHTLRANRLRTLLVALSMSLGAGAISLMVSLSKSGIATITHGIDEVGGRRLIFVTPPDKVKGQPKNYDKGITSADADALREALTGVSEVAYFSDLPNQLLVANGKRVEADVGVGGEYMKYNGLKIAYGRALPPDGDNNTARVVVISAELAQELFGAAADAVGKSLIVWGHRYEIIGVTTPKKEMGFNLTNNKRLAAFSAPVIIKDEGITVGGYVLIKDDGVHTDHAALKGTVGKLLTARHKGETDFEFFDMAAIMDKWETLFTGLRVLTGLIAAVSLFIAGAGIMNVLLASIRQRVQEIGIRQAIGASPADIRNQFLIESTLLAGMGGAIGAAFGLLGAGLANIVLATWVNPDWRSALSFEAAVVAVMIACGAGLVFGLAPARRASRLLVVNCLRGEA